MSRLRQLWAKTKEILRERGLKALLKAGVRFLMRSIYQRDLYYLYETPVRKDYSEFEARPRLNTNDIVFKIVSSNQEADELEAQNFKFRLYPTDLNHNLTTYTRCLDQGAIAFCTFVGQEFAAITWIVPSKQVQGHISKVPINVDYSNHEVFLRGAWVNPKYRGLGLYRYAFRNQCGFLLERGISTIRNTIQYSSKSGQRFTESLGYRKYGSGRLLRILWWRFWREYLNAFPMSS